MKKILLFIGLTTSVLALPAAAEEQEGAWKQTATFFTTSILGAAVAGPLGFVAGAMGGTWLAGNVRQADEAVGLRTDLDLAKQQLSQDQMKIAQLESDMHNLGEALASKLEFQVLFATGKDELIDIDLTRLNMLAAYLLRNTQLQVRLDGYADARGTDEYNNVLSMRRAENVALALNDMGVSKNRIEIYYHGAVSTPTAQFAADAQALQRRVDVQVFQATREQVAMDR